MVLEVGERAGGAGLDTWELRGHSLGAEQPGPGAKSPVLAGRGVACCSLGAIGGAAFGGAAGRLAGRARSWREG